MAAESSKPKYQPILNSGRNAFAIIDGHDGHETVFYRPLDIRMSITYLFQEVDHFVEEAVQEGEVPPGEKEELIRECRVTIANWFRR